MTKRTKTVNGKTKRLKLIKMASAVGERGLVLVRNIEAETAFWACTGPPTEDRCCVQQEAAPTTRANESKGKDADNANREKAEDGDPSVVVEPGMRTPSLGQDSDGHQSQPQKTHPPVKSMSDCHRFSLRVIGAPERLLLGALELGKHLFSDGIDLLWRHRCEYAGPCC